MKFSVITVFPEMIQQALQFGVLSQGIEKKLIEVDVCNPRQFAKDKHRTVDDRPFGGGDGMVMLYETLAESIRSVRSSSTRVIYLSPQGQQFNQKKVLELANSNQDLVLICGRYGGIDQRIINEFVDEEISVGDYVLSGGELGALIIIDAVSRWVPGVLGHHDSASSDSFSNGLLEAPQYSRPRESVVASIGGLSTETSAEVSVEVSGKSSAVPEVLLSGNHAKIADWRWKVSLLVTFQKRPELFWSYHNNWMRPSKKSRPLLEQLKNFWEELSLEERASLGLDQLENFPWEQNDN